MGTIAGIAAYIGFCLGVLKLFSMADSAASPEGKARARALLDFGWKDTVTRWPSVFCEMFDSIFGKRHFTWRCFGRSCVASLIAVAICTLIFWWLRPDYWSAEFDKQGPSLVPMIAIYAIFLNLVPDYISLLETRFVFRILVRHDHSWMAVLLAIIGDFLATITIFVAFMVCLGLVAFLIKVPPDIEMIERITSILTGMWEALTLDTPNHRPELSPGIFLWSTYFTSIWIWLYALATFAGKLLLPILNRMQRFKKFLDVDNKPFLAMGWLTVMIVTVLFAVGAIVKACV